MEFGIEPNEPVSAGAVVIATVASPGPAATLAAEPWSRGSLLAGVARRLSSLDAVVVVVRDENELSLVDGVPDVTVIIDQEWEEGVSSPLRVGLDWLTHATEVAAAFVINMNIPEVEPAVLDELAAAHANSETPVSVPKYRYARAGPVLLDRSIWPRFLSAEGDVDVEHFLLAHPQWVTEVRVDFAPPRRIVDSDDLLELAT